MTSKKKCMKPGEPGFEEWVQSICEADNSDDDSDAESIFSHHSDSEWSLSDVSPKPSAKSNTEKDAVESLEPSVEEEATNDVRENEQQCSASLPPSSPPLFDYWLQSPAPFDNLSPSISNAADEESAPDSSDDEPLAKKRRRLKKSYFFGKDRSKWSKNPPASTKTRSHNIISHLPGRKGPALQAGNYCAFDSSWKFLFDNSLVNLVVTFTNQKLESFRAKIDQTSANATKLTSYRPTNIDEIHAFFGLLFLTAIFKSGHEDLQHLFATDGTGREIFRATMSLTRFYVLLSCLRFDDSATRKERQKTDALAAVSEIFDKFVANCQKNYSIGEYACIDEMLVGFRGRCKFRMYIPSKPRKYGIKIQALVDAKTHYMLNAYVYTGKDSDGKTLTEEECRLPKPTQAVLRLVAPIKGTNRNVTGDNWYSSVPLVEELRKRNLTYVGTMKKNKREIPAEFLPSASREEQSSLFGFTSDKTLVSYVPKKKKAVVLISSMHHSNEIDQSTKKPEIIMFYNTTKGGVDALDEKCTIYSAQRRSRRWPLTIFYALLNISLVNAQVLFHSFPGNPTLTRAEFIKNLSRSLLEPHLNNRLANARIARQIRQTIGAILDKEPPADPPEENLPKRTRCGNCPRSRNKKTVNACYNCKKPVCTDCRKTVCSDCAK